LNQIGIGNYPDKTQPRTVKSNEGFRPLLSVKNNNRAGGNENIVCRNG